MHFNVYFFWPHVVSACMHFSCKEDKKQESVMCVNEESHATAEAIVPFAACVTWVTGFSAIVSLFHMLTPV